MSSSNQIVRRERHRERCPREELPNRREGANRTRPSHPAGRGTAGWPRQSPWWDQKARLQPVHNSYLFFTPARHSGSAFQGEDWRLGDCNRKHFLLWNALFRRASKELPKPKCQEKAPQRNNLAQHSTHPLRFLPNDRQCVLNIIKYIIQHSYGHFKANCHLSPNSQV